MNKSRPADVNEITKTPPAIEAEFEFEAALKRLGGNQELFSRLAARFANDITPMIADFRQYLKQGDISKATLTMHTLKGLAGTIGAIRMARHAAKVELRLHTGEVAIDIDSTLNIFSVLTARTQAALMANTGTLSLEITAPPSATAPIDATTLHTMMDELDTLLRSANMRATTVFSQLENAFGVGNKQQLAALSQAINKLDFNRSLQCSQELRASIERIS